MTFTWLQQYAGEEVVEHSREGRLTRREMMLQLVAIAGSAAGGAALLAACGGEGAATPTTATPGTASAGAATTSLTSTSAAATATSSPTTAAASTAAPSSGPVLSVAADDPAVRAESVTFPGPAGTMLGYLARPAADGQRAGVIVIHEIFGLTDHIRDVARRAAKAGYLALAPDLVSRAGGTDQAANVSGALTQSPVEDRVADLDRGFAFFREQPDFNGKLGVVGFCFGGGMTLTYAAAQPDVLAAVSYYGPTPQPPSVMSTTNAAILANYGSEDARVNAGIPDLEAALAGKTFEKRIYEGAGHAFNNDTRDAYNEDAAVAAWSATLDWFRRYLG